MNNFSIVFWFLLYCAIPIAAQTISSGSSFDRDAAKTTQPQISELVISPETISEIHLKPNFATTILMPEPVTNVVLGAPTLFDAEHSEHAPELVVIKPLTDHPAISNLWIATRSGQHVSLKLLSDGDAGTAGPVDYVLIYRKSHDFLIASDDPADAGIADQSLGARQPSLFETAFESQQHIASLSWNMQHDAKQPLKITASVGSVISDGDSTIVAFSVLNRSEQWVEVLPPQIELNNPGMQEESSKAKKTQKGILADQVPIREYRYTQRKLAPGARADGVVRFERPAYKQAQERLELELTTVDAVNHPLLLGLPFTAPPNFHQEESQNAHP